MPRPLVNPTVEVRYEIGRVIRGRERTGYQAIVKDPERWPDNTLDHRLARKTPVWTCPHAHTSESGAQLCGEMWIKERLREERGEADG